MHVENFFTFLQVTTFSEYCANKFEVEPVEVISANGISSIYPDLSSRSMEVRLSYISSAVGVEFETNQVRNAFSRH